jgi:glutathione S-transferase
MLDIYHSPGTRGFRVIWACEELGVRYNVVPVDFSAAYRAQPEWRRMNPVGKVPVMREGDLTMFESGAMMQYVIDCHGNGRLQPPVATPAHGLYLQWCWFAESTFARPLGEITNHRREFPEPIEAVIAEMRNRARLCVEALDAHLADQPYLVGDAFSGADIMMGYSLRGYQRNCPGFPLPNHVQSYFQRIAERPAYEATLASDASAKVSS